MRRIYLEIGPVLGILLVLAAATRSWAEQQPAPKETITIYEDDVLPSEPKTLAARVSEVSAAVRCRINSARVETGNRAPQVQKRDPKYDVDVFTEYLVTVLEVFKADQRIGEPGSTLSVIEPVGEAIVGTTRYRRVDDLMREFQPGEEYILLLQWDAYRQRFKIASSSDIFQVRDGTIESPGKHGYALEGTGTTVSAFASRMRESVKQ